MNDSIIVEADRIIAALPPGPRVAVLGSTSFYGADSEGLSVATGRRLAEHASLLLLTGGMTGVGVTFGDAAVMRRQELGIAELVFHLLPSGVNPCKRGETLVAGTDFEERREILGRVAQVYLVIEGGPGTEHEAMVAASRDVPIIPVARTGGHAAALYPRLLCPAGATSDDWAVLNHAEAGVEHIADAVQRIVSACFQRA